MTSNQPTLLEYARFYNVAEDYTKLCPIDYADETCELPIYVPIIEGLELENPEERLKEIDERFCTDLLMERLETKPEDLELLSGCLQLDSVKGNIWRGILPQVMTSDIKDEPILLTTEDERMIASSEFHAAFAQSPATSSSSSAPVRLVVPSGPDVPVVPVNTRDIFNYYNSGLPQSNIADGFTIPRHVPAACPNITSATSHRDGDAFPPLMGSSGMVPQFVSIETDSIDYDSGAYDRYTHNEADPFDFDSEAHGLSVPNSEHPTESEFSAFDFENAASSPPFVDVSSCNKSQPTFTDISPNLTKEKGFSVGRVDSQKAQVPRALKGKKGTKAFLEPVADPGIPCEQEGVVAASLSTLHEGKIVSRGCSSSSVTRPANDQIITQLARDSQNANDNNVSFKPPYEQNLSTTATHISSDMDKRESCLAQMELFRMKLGYKSPSTGLRQDPFKPPLPISSVDSKKTPKPLKAVSGDLGSLSLFMRTRGSDGGYITSSNDPSSLSLSGSTRIGEGEFSNDPSQMGDSFPDPNDRPSGLSRSPSPAFAMQEIVTRSAFYPPPRFFLSTTLLTTHPLVVRDMEGWPTNPPKLIYRNYENADSRYQCDAEILLAPDTGLILTTPHELTQRYLPGHGPRDTRFNGIAGINSPFREKIFRLMHRYMLLVILICKPDRADVSRVANASLRRESQSLAEFCDSYEELSTTLLIPIPNHSLYIVLWCFGMGRLRYDLFPAEMMENITDEESDYEVALRDLGINPFAARFILDNIRVRDFSQYPPSFPSHETIVNASADSMAFDVFINMERSRRIREYGSTIGAELMYRVSEVIELMAHSSTENETGEDMYGTQISID
ncbi:hypothetical protein DTO006G1_718 [Penicillium roqueforti]|nr:hypothetical protein CBS147372_271 [Penicillium roqueforti]KAI2764300.1 hypothetical protein DTO006G1_718 [Penicillium roqueforti]KAI3141718.1 hypothetical protein CBS147326_1805 [Penicillium roqueforti]KAI3259377.1 hypothetical protein DTO006G7_268 [Penicillium roqueforti]KAI3282790.1 hypothetical protein CBS147309_840 [Penicillium roqueforti]